MKIKHTFNAPTVIKPLVDKQGYIFLPDTL